MSFLLLHAWAGSLTSDQTTARSSVIRKLYTPAAEQSRQKCSSSHAHTNLASSSLKLTYLDSNAKTFFNLAQTSNVL